MNKDRDGERLVKFGEHLRKTRDRLELSQDQVVAKCDVMKWNLGAIENGKKDFTFTTLLEIAKGLGVPAKDLLDY